jgi:DNA-binding response OmpR family regulator
MARILVIDDERLVRTSIEAVLSVKGHSVTLAADGREGLTQINKSEFDLIITDLVMPEMEGIETILEIRKKSSNLRILAISGGGLRIGNFLGVAAELGADEVLKKPFTNAELLAAVDRLVA